MKEKTVLLTTLAKIGALPDALVLRNNVGGFTDKTGRFVRFGLGVGSPDLVVIMHGRIFGIELKSATGKPSKEQLLCHANWANFGALVFICRDSDEALEAVWQMRRVAAPCMHTECDLDMQAFKKCFKSRSK